MIVKEDLKRLIDDAIDKTDSAITDYNEEHPESALEELKGIYKMLKPIFEEKTPATESPDE